MRKQFAELYFRVYAESKPEQLEKRWQGIEEYCNQNEFDIYNLIKMAYSLNPTDEFKDEFTTIFQNIDISFQANFTKEQELLSSICLMKLMEDSDLSLHIALAVMCVSKYNIEILVPELGAAAYKVFGERSAEIREKSTNYKKISTANSNKLIESLKDLTVLDTNHIAGLSNALTEIVKNIGIITKNQDQTLDIVNILQEDSDILSWITGSWSNELGKQLTKATLQKDVALLLAKELADFVQVIPGPYAFEVFLKKMLDNCKKETKEYSLVTMVDSIDDVHKSSILSCYQMDGVKQENTPILFSIKCALDAKQPDVWKSMASNKLSI
ncbi:MAG: GTPase-associated system all-helical protein GASH, partial [Dysgonamonadaceae bacterium]|nr:GTPase-associated system all-helical protein GASH [Dysgonamonadaceae bacterium]